MSKILAIMLIITTSPVLILIYIISYIMDGPPVVYYQQRIGFKFAPFRIIKFRSMIITNDDSRMITEEGDPRITPWGNLLRKTKLDELPQLINIAKGDMKFVGPRPEVSDYVTVEDFSFLSFIKPGMTDYASVIFRNESIALQKVDGCFGYTDLLKIKLELSHLYSTKRGRMHAFSIVLITIISLVFPSFASRFVIEKWVSPHDISLARRIKPWLN